MEKILLAQDARNQNRNTIDFACYICRLTGSRLTGVFLEDLLSEDRPVMRTIQGEPYRLSGAVAVAPGGEGVAGIAAENIRIFKPACDRRGVQTLIHRDRGVPASEIVEESRFADLIIVDPETSFTRSNEAPPGRFVRDTLLDSECPVIISPYSFDSIDTILFAYNGTRSSVFAMKQFTYLFPE